MYTCDPQEKSVGPPRRSHNPSFRDVGTRNFENLGVIDGAPDANQNTSVFPRKLPNATFPQSPSGLDMHRHPEKQLSPNSSTLAGISISLSCVHPLNASFPMRFSALPLANVTHNREDLAKHESGSTSRDSETKTDRRPLDMRRDLDYLQPLFGPESLSKWYLNDGVRLC